MGEQKENIERVSKKIGDWIFDFCRERMKEGRYEFYMNQLSQYVADRVATTYDSCSRILRMLKGKGVLLYEVVSRKDSLYRLLWLKDGDEILINPMYKPLKDGQQTLF